MNDKSFNQKIMNRNHYDIYNIEHDARMDTWIWLYERKKNDGHIACDFAGHFAQTLARAVGVDEFFRLRDSESKRFLLPADTLRWIVKDTRQIKWLLKYIQSHLHCDIPDCPAALHGRDRVIASLDLWEISLDDKYSDVRKMEQAWYEILRADDLFDWFKEDQAVRVEFAWKWLVKSGRANGFKGAPVSNLKNLLAFYDQIDADVSIRKLDTQNIKSSFSFKKNVKQKEEKGMSQCNVWISHDTKSKLESMCLDFRLSKTELIDKLIISEFERKKSL
jgi:hypothetical protein